MKNTFHVFINYSLLILILARCGTADSISNSAGPSSPSNIIMNLKANPPSVDSGGASIITVTTLFNSSGAPAVDVTVTAASGSGGSLDVASATTDSNGQAFFTVTITAPATITFTVEDIAASIRINMNA